MNHKLIRLGGSALLLLPILAGCHKDPVASSSSTTEDWSSSSSLPVTAYAIAADGKSDYSIVIPEDASGDVTFAASELQTFFADATGITLPILSDTNLSFDEDKPYFSLGKTSIFEGTKLTFTDEMRLTGYYLKRFGRQVVIASKDDKGLVSGVYDLLKYLVNLEIYNVDEYDYDKKTNIALPDFDIAYIPMIDVRELLYKSLSNDSTYTRRMKFYYAPRKWGAFAHTTISQFLPLATYYADHPDWYAANKSQVCYSNPEVLQEMARRVEQCIESNPEAVYIQIGHEDNHDMCMCDACVAERQKYGGLYSWQELRFTNDVATIVDEWLAQVHPDRTIKYVFFAYQTSAEPPVRYDEATKQYSLYDPDLKIRDNVMVMFAPIDMNFSKPLTDEVNAAQLKQLQGWRYLFDYSNQPDGIYVWTYSLLCYAAFVPQNNFGSFVSQYRTFADYGCCNVFDQAQYQCGTPCFEGLKIYTQAKAMYSRDFDYNAAAADYIQHYYGPAGDAMQKLHDYLVAYYQYLTEEKNMGGGIMTTMYDKNFFPLNVCYDIQGIIEEGITAIASLQESDPARYSVLYDRLRREECFPLFLLFYFYLDSMPQSEKEAGWNILNTYTKKYDMTCSAESRFNVDEYLENWRKAIFGEGN